MVQSVEMEGKQESAPIDIPESANAKIVPDSSSVSPSSLTKPHHEDHLSSDEDLVIPDGSPSFVAVMHDLHISSSQEELPISPLALPSSLSAPTFDADFIYEQERKSPPLETKGSPDPRRKRIQSATTAASSGSRYRSYSWNHRHKMAAERRKAMQKLPVPTGNSSGPSSTNSSPLNLRRLKSRSQPSTPKVTRLIPKFKFLTETVCVSHEDIVKEQERVGGAEESKSIFDNPKFDRFGESPA